MDTMEFTSRKDQLASYISSLLHRHDCVILPGFGGFIGNYSAAKVHPVTYVYNPPSKQVLFNPKLKQDDGLLVNLCAAERRISFGNARKWLTESLEALSQHLTEKKVCSLPSVGEFRMDVEGVIRFSQSEVENFLPEAFGLYTIRVQPIQRRPIPERRPEQIFKNPEPKTLAKRPDPVRIRRWAVAAVMTLALFSAIRFVPEPTVSSLNLSSYASPAPEKAIPAAASGSMPAPRRVAADLDLSFSAETARIFIVAGCYSSRSNAEGMIQYLHEKGYPARILDHTPAGLLRVVYNDFPDLATANAEVQNIRNDHNPEAWILVR